MRCYREALADEPNQETAKTRLRVITVALEKQVGIELCAMVHVYS